MINNYFRQLGLTRLAELHAEVEPGTVILVRDQQAFLADHILDYVDRTADSTHELSTLGGSSKDEADVLLRHFSGNTQLSGKAAMSFLKNVFGLKSSLDLGLKGPMTIELPDVKVRRMRVATLQKFLTRNDSREFQAKVRAWIEKGLIPYIAYEVYRAKSIRLRSGDNTEIAPNLRPDTVTPLPVEGEIQGVYKKIAINELLVAGNRYYTFAIRTVRLELEQDQTVNIELTSFATPKELGHKSASIDNQYAAPLVKRFDPVRLKSIFTP